MGLGAGLRWVAREGIGLGAWRRFRQVVRVKKKAPTVGEMWLEGVLREFLVSAETAIHAFGPGWSQQLVKGKTFGTWLLVVVWITPVVGFAMLLLL